MNFGFLNNEFINLYSDENPILTIDDICYGLITNIDDFHRPIIVKCKIVDMEIPDGLHIQYFVNLLEIIETPKIISKFVKFKPFIVYKNVGSVGKKTVLSKIIESDIFKIDAFFIRKDLKQIEILRKDYLTIIKKELLNNINDIDEII